MIHLLTAANEGFAPGLLVMVASGIAFLDPGEEITVHVLGSGLSPRTCAGLQHLCDTMRPGCTLKMYPVTEAAFQGMTPGAANSRMYYARLLMGSLLSADKVIYLDSDILVQLDLADAWKMDLHGLTAIACGDRNCDKLGKDCPWPLTDAEKDGPYFNSGFMVIDLKRWRERSLEAATLQLAASTAGQYNWHDQTVLNYLLRNDYVPKDTAWNFQYKECSENGEPIPANLHYIAGNKPWRFWSGSLRHRLWRLHYKTFLGSPLRLLLAPEHRKGLLTGMSEVLLTRLPLLRAAYVKYLRLRGTGGETLKYYTTGQGGPAGDSLRAEEDEAFRKASATLQERVKILARMKN